MIYGGKLLARTTAHKDQCAPMAPSNCYLNSHLALQITANNIYPWTTLKMTATCSLTTPWVLHKCSKNWDGIYERHQQTTHRTCRTLICYEWYVILCLQYMRKNQSQLALVSVKKSISALPGVHQKAGWIAVRFQYFQVGCFPVIIRGNLTVC